jgi:hypothetical protein
MDPGAYIQFKLPPKMTGGEELIMVSPENEPNVNSFELIKL